MPRRIILASAIGVILILLLNRQERFLILDGQKIELEIARTPSQREQGLSGRASLPENSGMLFVYQNDVVPAFWMKEMNFPIDIVWLDKDWQVAGIEKNVAPDTYPQTFSPPRPIRYVLEVNGDFVDKQQIKVGDRAYN